MTPSNGGNQRLKKNQSWIDKNCSETPIFVSDDKSWDLGAVQWSECSVKEHFCFLPPVELKHFFSLISKIKVNMGPKIAPKLTHKDQNTYFYVKILNNQKIFKNIGPLIARFKPT